MIATNVQPGSYFVRVRSYAAGVAGPPSNDINVVVVLLPPGPPRFLTTAVAGSTVTLAWARPTSGGTPFGYVIEAGSGPGLSNLAVIARPVGNTAFQVQSVWPGFYYVARGTTPAILGPNGAGKTVLFKALISAIPFDGAVRWAPGTRLGYVPQKLDLERDVPITGLDFLRARAALAREPEASVAHALTLVGVSYDTARQPIGVVSGGQFQRLLLAFALVGRPNVLLLDEPTAGVDELGVTTHDGVVTLTGFVTSYAAKLAAERTARRVYAVKAVANDLQVKLAG